MKIIGREGQQDPFTFSATVSPGVSLVCWGNCSWSLQELNLACSEVDSKIPPDVDAAGAVSGLQSRTW